MVDKGIAVYAVREDLARRGIPTSDLVPGVALVSGEDLARLCDAHDQVWHW